MFAPTQIPKHPIERTGLKVCHPGSVGLMQVVGPRTLLVEKLRTSYVQGATHKIQKHFPAGSHRTPVLGHLLST